MRICGMFGHKEKEKNGKILFKVDEAKSFDFENPEKYLEENGSISIPLEGKTKSREEGR